MFGCLRPHQVGVLLAASCLAFGFASCSENGLEDETLNDIAQDWMSLCRNCMAVAQAPTVDARTAFHLSAAMYEAWAAYDEVTTGYFTGHRLKVDPSERSLVHTHETLSHAAYALLRARFANMPGAGTPGTPGNTAYQALKNKMLFYGYVNNLGAPTPSPAQALGATIGEIVLEFAANDGANEANGYVDTSGYAPLNNPTISEESGSNGMAYPNNWAPLIAMGATQEQSYLTPHWGEVSTFAIGPFDPDTPRFPVPAPPLLGTESEQQFIDEAVEVLRISSSLDPTAGPGAVAVNLSPRVRGIDTPGIIYESHGHAMNPYTREPYEDHIVPLGDYLRALAMYHDGATYVTPPPWWIEVATGLMRGEGVVDQIPANKHKRYDLGYDVKLYFIVTAAVHDAAINCWDIKRRWDTSRPISQVRYLDEEGLLPVEEGFIELIGEEDPLAGEGGEFVGRYKVMAWAGPNQGVDWIRVADWRPYQPLDFVAPPFPAYNSGHTNMSRAAAEAFTAFTNDPYFPGGLGRVPVDELRFEEDLSTRVTLQWATYQDIADETAFARLTTGVHVRADLEWGRPTGAAVGQMVVEKAFDYFEGRGVAVAKDFQ
ncbi:MAG: hypothetical protein HYV27_16890 [Candidatus Hydrogenedentes bacterium]|nr:hypothetical protein [Candidatus Hydrogenedentota bacterium]